MKPTILLVVLTSCLLASCKKTHTCSCFDPGGVFKTYEIKDTRKNAVQKCTDYSSEYQTTPWSETACSLN